MRNQEIAEKQLALSRRLRSWDGIPALASSVILIMLIGLLSAACGDAPSDLNSGLRPPPRTFLWSEQATQDSKTPQEAYAAAMRLKPCLYAPSATPGMGNPPQSAVVTWIVASPNYGLARIDSVCAPQSQSYHRWLFELYHDSTPGWRPEGGYFVGHWSSNPRVTAPAPAWLSLPDDTYNFSVIEHPGIVTYPQPEASVVTWDAQTRLFIFGHIADRATEPVNATKVVVDDLSGWMTKENGMVTITAVLSDGTTLFFSGTAAPADAQTLAAQAFAHVSKALQPLHSPITTPSAASGAGN